VNASVSTELSARVRLLAAGALVFVLSRVVARLSGVFFDESALQRSWQHLDAELLRHRLLESLFYLHSQPPVFNAFLGVVLKLAGAASHAVFYLSFSALGAALYYVLYRLMRRLGVSRACAFVVSSGFVVSPSYILYEHWLFYTLPLALLVGFSALSLSWLFERKTFGSCALFFFTLAILCGTHGIFHLLYLLLCIVLVLLARVVPPRIVLLSASLPTLLVFALYAKNAAVFGQFTTSTWMGMNVALHRVDSLPAEERARLVARGALSDVAMVKPFSALDSYPAHYAEVDARFAAIPALAAPRKQNGEPNLNHVGYIEIAKRYGEDTRFVVEHYPGLLVESVARGWTNYFKPSSKYWFLDPNLNASALVRAESRWFDAVVYGVPAPNRPGIVLVFGIPLLVAYALRVAIRPRRVSSLSLTFERRLVLVFCAGTISFVAVVANTLNTLENMRIRFMTDPLLVVILAFWIEAWLAPWLRRVFARGAVAVGG
jgi:hypothetical protein